MARMALILAICSLPSICFATRFAESDSSRGHVMAEIESKLARDPEFASRVSQGALKGAVSALRSSSLNQIADASGSTSPQIQFKCVQIRGAIIFMGGYQLGIAACGNSQGTYLIKYSTRNMLGMPSTIGFGLGAAVTGFILSTSEQDITGDYTCTYKGGAVGIGGALMYCSTDFPQSSSSKPGTRNLELKGISLGAQAEYGIFEIQVW